MGYSKEQYERATAELRRRRTDAEAAAAALKARAEARDPRVAQISLALSRSTLSVTRLVLGGMDGGTEDIGAALRQVQEENLQLQQELKERLHAMGEGADNFEPRPVCPHCGDTGYVGQRMCSCLESLLRQAACDDLSALSHMNLTRFDELDMSFYSAEKEADGLSPRERMADVIAYCRDWAADFSDESPSLLLRGPAGTGKTHVSLAMAREVTEKGCRVVYGSVGRLLRQIEREHFGREEGDSIERMESCDLLILDDLGTEFASPFYTSSLYELINDRILSGRPTVLSTNLNQKQLQERYGVQIASRISGCFQPLIFAGSDIRQQKLLRGLGDE